MLNKAQKKKTKLIFIYFFFFKKNWIKYNKFQEKPEFDFSEID